MAIKCAPATLTYTFDLVPTCEICDDRYCGCGRHSTYHFKGIEVPERALNPEGLAISIGYDLVDASFMSHRAENITLVL